MNAGAQSLRAANMNKEPFPRHHGAGTALFGKTRGGAGSYPNPLPSGPILIFFLR